MNIISASDAAKLVKNGDTITIGGFGHCGSPECLLDAVQQRFISTGTPKSLSVVFASGPGDREHKGINKLAHEGLLERIVGGFWALAPKLGHMVKENKIAAYNWPQGVVSQMYRTIASGRPALITKVGLGTFIDPSQSGGKLNDKSDTDLIERLDVAGSPMLAYKAMPIHVALLRGSFSDERGNISMEEEANIQDVLAQAQAARNSGGLVIVQVKGVRQGCSVQPDQIRIPGVLVDYVVVASEDQHWQTYGEKFNPAYTGSAVRVIEHRRHKPVQAPPLNAKRIIARRALLELHRRSHRSARRTPLVVNLGIGTPEFIAAEAALCGMTHTNQFTLTVESGAIGGTPVGGDSFGASRFPEALMSQADLFDLYDGGGIDLSFLGYGQLDKHGQINVASLGGRINGVGGFINISQAAKSICFCGTFTSGGLRIEAQDGHLAIQQEGRHTKFVDTVDQICFRPAGYSRSDRAMLITERAVFDIRPDRIELIEIAPGIDIERDVLDRIPFEVIVSAKLQTMPTKVFATVDIIPAFES